MNYLTVFGLVLGSFIACFPVSVDAVVYNNISSMNTPVPAQSYSYLKSVTFSGEWKLQPDWSGNIYYVRDGIELGYTTIINNSTTTELFGTFSFDTGTSTSGLHTAGLKFVGGRTCVALGTCAKDATNFVYDIYPSRSFSIGPTPYPRLTVLCTQNDLNFGVVAVGEARSAVCSVSNTGSAGTIVSGVMLPSNPLAAPFYCDDISNCTYVGLAPGGPSKSFSVRYSPTGSELPGDNPVKDMTFTCSSCLITSLIKVARAQVAAVPGPGNLVFTSASIGFPMTNISVTSAPIALKFKNTGGVDVSATIQLPFTEYTCEGGCSVVVPATGIEYSKNIFFRPVTATAYNGNISFGTVSSGVSPTPIPVTGLGNANPVIQITSPVPVVTNRFLAPYPTSAFTYAVGEVKVGFPAAIGSPSPFWVTNLGAGLLSGSVQLESAPAGFTCVSGCTYSNIANGSQGQAVTFSYNPPPLENGPRIATIRLTDDTNPGTVDDILVTITMMALDAPRGGSGINGWPTVFNFSDVYINASSTQPFANRFRVQNIGTRPLTGTIPLTVGEFTCNVLLYCGTFTLNADEFIDFSYIFFPVGISGIKNQNFTLATNSSTTDIQYSLRGTGVQPGINVSPTSLQLPDGNIDSFSSQAYINVRNMASGGTSDPTIHYWVEDSLHFHCVHGVPPNDPCDYSGLSRFSPNGQSFLVQFSAPGVSGLVGDPLDMNNESVVLHYAYSNDPIGTDRIYAPGIHLWANVNSNPVFETASTSIDCAPLPGIQANTSKTCTVQIRNKGIGNIDVSSVEIVNPSGAVQSIFQCISGCGNPFALAGQIDGNPPWTNLVVAFSPPVINVAKTYSGYKMLVHTTINGLNTTYTVFLNGSAVELPDLRADVSFLDFGSVQLASTSELNLNLTNTGLGSLNFSNIFTVDATHFRCTNDTLHTCFGSIASGVTKQVKVSFTPTAVSDPNILQTSLRVMSNATSSAPLGYKDFPIFGKSTFNKVISLIGSDTSFGTAPVFRGRSKIKTFTVRNDGDANLGRGEFIVIPRNTPVIHPSLLDGLIGYWKMDVDSMYLAYDSSSYVNHASLVGNPQWAVGTSSGSLLFSALTQEISANVANVQGLATGNTPHTISAWIKVNGVASKRSWILLLGNEGTGSHHWLLQTDGVTKFGAWNGQQFSPILPVGKWKLVTMTFDGGIVKCYVDGVLLGSSVASFNLIGMPLTMGKFHISESGFNGNLDDVRIYNRALTADEVGWLYSDKSTNVGNITCVTTCFYNLPAHGTQSIQLRFSPTQLGTTTADVKLSGVPDVNFDVSGYGVRAVFQTIER